MYWNHKFYPTLIQICLIYTFANYATYKSTNFYPFWSTCHTNLPMWPDLIIFQNLKYRLLSRWNSLSNDEMVRIREDRFMLDFHKFNTRIPPQPPPSNMLPKSNMVQMANVTVMPKSDEQPRKFSKYNPPRKRRSRNATEELIYIRQNFPSERYYF